MTISASEFQPVSIKEVSKLQLPNLQHQLAVTASTASQNDVGCKDYQQGQQAYADKGPAVQTNTNVTKKLIDARLSATDPEISSLLHDALQNLTVRLGIFDAAVESDPFTASRVLCDTRELLTLPQVWNKLGKLLTNNFNSGTQSNLDPRLAEAAADALSKYGGLPELTQAIADSFYIHQGLQQGLETPIALEVGSETFNWRNQIKDQLFQVPTVDEELGQLFIRNQHPSPGEILTKISQEVKLTSANQAVIKGQLLGLAIQHVNNDDYDTARNLAQSAGGYDPQSPAHPIWQKLVLAHPKLTPPTPTPEPPPVATPPESPAPPPEAPSQPPQFTLEQFARLINGGLGDISSFTGDSELGPLAQQILQTAEKIRTNDSSQLSDRKAKLDNMIHGNTPSSQEWQQAMIEFWAIRFLEQNSL